jgi:translocation and assembly module TamB
MARHRRVLAWLGGFLLGLPLLIGAAGSADEGSAAEQVEPKPGLVERIIEKLTGGDVVIRGLGGSLTVLRAQRVELRDPKGTWLLVKDLTLDWSPLRLLKGNLRIKRLAAPLAELKRKRISSGTSTNLPVSVTVDALDVSRLQVDEDVAGSPAAFAVNGNGRLQSLEQGSVKLDAHALGSQGRYQIEGSFGSQVLQAGIKVTEAADGPLARFAGLTDVGPIDLDASLNGPRSAVAARLALEAGPFDAYAQGQLDLLQDAADLSVRANASAMRPRPDLSWQSVALDASVQGPFKRPSAHGDLRIQQLSAAGMQVETIAAKIQGDAGQVQLRASLQGLQVPGERPDVFGAHPVEVTADAHLDEPRRPVTFTLSHPLIAADGQVLSAGNLELTAALKLPELAPLAAIAGADLQGHSQWQLRAAQQAGKATLDAEGTLGITGGMAPMPGLMGDSAKIAASGSIQGQKFTLSRLTVDGKTLRLSADGAYAPQAIKLDWRLALSELKVLSPTLAGSVQATGAVHGPTDDFTVNADVNGELGVQDLPRAPIEAHLQAGGLPKSPSGEIRAQGALAGAPLQLAVLASRTDQGAIRLDVKQADWKSAHAEGQLTLPAGAYFPIGSLDLRMTRLEDLQPVVGQPLTGSFTASLATTEQDGTTRAQLSLDARSAGLRETAAVDHLVLTATVVDPTKSPRVGAILVADGFSGPGVSGSARMKAAGPLDALALEAKADMRDLAGSPARLTTAAVLDATAQQIAVSELRAEWKGETLSLPKPTQVTFARGLAVEGLRVGVQQAVLEASGRLIPTLDLNAQVRNLSPALAAAFVPGLQAKGTLRADAELHGTLASPAGTMRLEGSGLRLTTGPASSLPPANLVATAELTAGHASIDSRVSVGPKTQVTVTGKAVLSPAGPLDLRADGAIDLALVDPILTASGRRVRGRVLLNAGVVGTLAKPRLTGTVQLNQGNIRDYAQGAHLSSINALLQLEGDSVRIARFTAQAGPGTVSASGTIGILAPDLPIDLSITATNARPLASDLLTVDLDADLTARGQLLTQFLLAGLIHIDKADIRIPETLPASVATLDVRRPGEQPPPPPSLGPTIDLALTIEVPRQIFVRGRGLDAELGGRVRLAGTAANPKPLGSFELRRGQFSLAGQTLAFTKGRVSFNGGSLTNPSLDFTVSSTNGNITAELNIGGTVSNPKITLSSTPELPQDEVLAQLLFGRSASSLSPLEIAQIASALAELTGVTSGGINPLGKVRKALGLSQLSVGTGAAGKPTLEAGRYVAPNVYVGVEQGASAGSTRGKVQVDLTKRLKLEATVGTGSGSATGAAGEAASSVGITYQFEY